MTKTTTGIEIRKSILALGLRPSAYDEQKMFEVLNHPYWPIPLSDMTDIQKLAVFDLFLIK